MRKANIYVGKIILGVGVIIISSLVFFNCCSADLNEFVEPISFLVAIVAFMVTAVYSIKLMEESTPK